MPKDDNDQLSEAETERRREAALKRMLATPPTPHKPLKAAEGSPKKVSGRPKGPGSARK